MSQSGGGGSGRSSSNSSKFTRAATGAPALMTNKGSVYKAQRGKGVFRDSGRDGGGVCVCQCACDSFSTCQQVYMSLIRCAFFDSCSYTRWIPATPMAFIPTERMLRFWCFFVTVNSDSLLSDRRRWWKEFFYYHPSYFVYKCPAPGEGRWSDYGRGNLCACTRAVDRE